MHIDATFWYSLICCGNFIEEVVAKQCFPTLIYCNILSLIEKWHLDTDYEISTSCLQIYMRLQIYVLY